MNIDGVLNLLSSMHNDGLDSGCMDVSFIKVSCMYCVKKMMILIAVTTVYNTL